LAGLEPRVVLERLREKFRRLELMVKGLVAFLGGGALAEEEVDGFLARCAEAVGEPGGVPTTG
jgi:hypothetical protein